MMFAVQAGGELKAKFTLLCNYTCFSYVLFTTFSITNVKNMSLTFMDSLQKLKLLIYGRLGMHE